MVVGEGGFFLSLLLDPAEIISGMRGTGGAAPLAEGSDDDDVTIMIVRLLELGVLLPLKRNEDGRFAPRLIVQGLTCHDKQVVALRCRRAVMTQATGVERIQVRLRGVLMFQA